MVDLCLYYQTYTWLKKIKINNEKKTQTNGYLSNKELDITTQVTDNNNR